MLSYVHTAVHILQPSKVPLTVYYGAVRWGKPTVITAVAVVLWSFIRISIKPLRMPVD